jgi:hypothetical protein
MGITNDTLSQMEWNIKYRLPYSETGEKGILLSKSKAGVPFSIWKNKHLNMRKAMANKFVNNFTTPFDIAHLYGRMPGAADSVEIARFDKEKKCFAFLF